MRSILLLSLLLACSDKKDVNTQQEGETADPGEDDGYEVLPGATLLFELESESTPAGGEVGYSLVLDWTDEEGIGQSEPVEGDLSSDMEPLLHHDPNMVRPVVAGTQLITAAVWHDGETVTATATLEVSPVETAAVDLSLSDLAFEAGGSVDWQVLAWDRFGNPVDASAAEVSLSSTDLALSGGRITGSVPGTYSATATLDGVSDKEVLVVLAGAPYQVELELSDAEVELYETTSAIVTVTDAHGNPVEADWTLTVDGDGSPTVSGRNITFWDEGYYTVRVDVDGTSLHDEVGPLLVDSTGPVIDLDEPSRGGWQSGTSGSVTGTLSEEWSGISSLVIDDTAVTVASDGSFSQTLGYDFGLNIVETMATDGDGNVSTDTRAVLAGSFLPEGDAVDEGMVVRLHEGTGGLGTLEVLGEDLISATDLTALIPSPVVNRSSQSCAFGVCVTWYSVKLYVTNPGFSGTDLSLDPRSTGNLLATFQVDDVEMDWSANGKVAGVSWSASGAITADYVRAALSLLPSVNAAHQIQVALQSTTVTTNNFYFDMNGSLYNVLSFFGLDGTISGLIEGYVESALEDAVQDAVPDILDEALSDLEIATSLDVQGNTYHLDALPYDIDIDANGLSLDLSTTFEPETWVNAYASTAPGSLYYDYAMPSWTGSPGTIVGVNEDFLNQVLYAFWGGGILDMEMDSSALGLDPADLAFLFPSASTLTLTTEALLPPVVVPGTGAELLDMQVGDLLITLYNGDATAGNELIQVYVSVVAGLDVAVSGDTLQAGLGGTELYFDVVYPEANGMAAADTEALLEALVPLLLPTLTDALGEIPIPDIQGFTISSISVGTGGAQDGYVTLGGSLTAN